MTSRSAYKKTEARHSAKLGTVRTPLSGSNSKMTRSDSLSTYWFMESKLRAQFPFVKKFFRLCDIAKARGRMPIFIIHKDGEQYIAMKFNDFVKITHPFKPSIHAPNFERFYRGQDWYVESIYLDKQEMALVSLFNRTARFARQENKVPILIMHPKGKQRDILFTGLDILLRHISPSNASKMSKMAQQKIGNEGEKRIKEGLSTPISVQKGDAKREIPRTVEGVSTEGAIR